MDFFAKNQRKYGHDNSSYIYTRVYNSYAQRD